jgi:hypothetical protein
MYRQRQGGDLTGFTGLLDVVAPKALELLSELVPTATIVALLTTDGSSKRGDMRWLRIRGVDVSLVAGCASRVLIARSMLRAKARVFCLRMMCSPMMTYAWGGL